MAHIAKGDKSIELIIGYAIDEIAEKGNNVTINQICEKHNISKGRMYHFFTSKEDLLYHCVKYSLDQVTKTITDFETDDNLSLKKNLHNYYLTMINHWLRHPNEIIVIRTIMKMASYAFSEENKKKLINLKNEWASAVTSKFINIIKNKNKKMRVNDIITGQIISTLYKQLFLTFSNELISALKEHDYVKAKAIKVKLLKYYDILISTFLYGILDE